MNLSEAIQQFRLTEAVKFDLAYWQDIFGEHDVRTWQKKAASHLLKMGHDETDGMRMIAKEQNDDIRRVLKKGGHRAKWLVQSLNAVEALRSKFF